MAKGGGGGGGGGGSGGAGGRSAGGGGGAEANAPLTGAEAAKELKSIGFTDVPSGKDLERALTSKFGKMPTSTQLKQLTGASQIAKSDIIEGSVSIAPSGSIKINLTARGIDMARTISKSSNGETRAYHDHLFLSQRLQGTGLGKRMVRDQVRAYTGLNVKKVDLFAAEIGRYAWAKMGFNGDRRGVIQAKREFAQYLRKEKVPGAAKIVRSAKTLHDIATTRVDGKKVGKSFLLQGKNRDMTLRLDPKDKGFQTFKREVDL